MESTLFAGAITFLVVGMLLWIVICIIADWKIFTKAGEKGWKSLIPIYSGYISFKLTWNVKMFWVTFACSVLTSLFRQAGGILGTLVSLLGIVTAVISVIQLHKLSKAFGHGVGFSLGLIFLNPIFMLILAFDSSQYQGPQ